MTNTISAFRIRLDNLRGLAMNDNKLETEKNKAAMKYHDIVGILDTHLDASWSDSCTPMT